MEPENKDKRQGFKVLMLRLMAGGYLIYLAYHLLKEKGPSSGVVYLLGPAFFLMMGAILCVFAIAKIAKREFKGETGET